MSEKAFFKYGILLQIFAVALLAAAYLRPEAVRHVPDSDLNVAPVSAAPPQNPPPRQCSVDAVVGGNVFSKLRGREEAAAEPQKQQNASPVKFELMGCFNSGKSSGALISSSSSGIKKNMKRLFRVGEEVGAGYLLKSVGADSAVVSNGTNDISISLKKADHRKKKEAGEKTK